MLLAAVTFLIMLTPMFLPVIITAVHFLTGRARQHCTHRSVWLVVLTLNRCAQDLGLFGRTTNLGTSKSINNVQGDEEPK